MEGYAGPTSRRKLSADHLPGTKILFGTLPVFIVGAYAGASSTWFPQWLFYLSAAFVLLEVTIMACAAFLAIPKYRAERALGYTTWPSGEELGQ